MTFIRIAAMLVVLGLSSPASSNELSIQDLTSSFTEFRQTAMMNPQTAFSRYATAKSAAKLSELGGILCPVSDRNLGWQFFFGTSIGAMTSLTEKTSLTMFYCPWADVALLCEWTNPAGVPQISDAELVAGDMLRKAKQPEMRPLWRRDGTIPPPLANVVAASDTVKAFLDIYGKKTLFKAADWRGKLSAFKSKNQVDVNRTLVGILFSQALSATYTFFNEDAMGGVRESMHQAMGMLQEGRLEELLAVATETTDEGRRVLSEVPLRWEEATMVALVTDAKNAFVFWADLQRPAFFASFWFSISPDAKQATLRRIDFLGHTLSRDQVDALARQAGIKR